VAVRRQGQNLDDCFQKLQEMVNLAYEEPKVRKLKTSLSAATKATYVGEKRHRSDVKKTRSRVDKDV
jgi:hypothetical protein